MRFSPLHVYSAYSFLKSGLTINKMVSSLQKNKYFGMGIMDINAMYGIPEFVNAIEKIKKPFIIGMEVELEGNTYCLYVKDEIGYLNLIHISTSIQENAFDKNILLNNIKGLICVLDISHGVIKETFLNNLDNELAISYYLNEISKPFETFFVGIELKAREEVPYVKQVREFCKKHTYDTVAFPHIKYQNKEDAIVLNIVDAIANDERLEIKQASGTQYFMSLDDYKKIYTSEELENSCKIVEMSTFNLHQKRGEMLHFTETNPDMYLKNECYESLKAKGLDGNKEYVDRLNYELSVIDSMGYNNYFLLVQDYVNWSRKNDILVGVRGSAAGSLVAYLLNISRLDPIRFELQFERFLNPSRKTMPDIDIDFMDTRRNEVVDYCRNKYGNDKVATIVTYQSILAKQSLRDIGRVYGYPTGHINKLCSLLGDSKYSLRDAYRHVPEFRKLIDSDKYFLEIVSLASKIEGLIRQPGLHPAGVIFNNHPIKESLPIAIDNDNVISQYAMNYLEDQGFLKMDFLNLIHLTVISTCVDLINKRHPDVKLDKFNLPYDDEKVYELIRSLQTMGIFQLESAGMKNAISILRPTTFDDVAALLALYRPGPMKEIKTYANRKKGLEPIPEMDKGLAKILNSTYGIIVYQEQVNALAVTMAGMSLADADNFRRAVSKKKIEILSSMKEAFINGSIKNGYSKETAYYFYNRIERFADYAFNKSHAYGYALLSCQMLYLKAYYPLEFYSVFLDDCSDSGDVKFQDTVREMKKRDINLLLPNINKSGLSFEIDNNNLLFPLTLIKGVNIIICEKIIEERENGLFIDFFDFVVRMKKHGLNESHLQKLIDGGVFDSLHPSRASLRASIPLAIRYSSIAYNERDGSLFEGIEKPQMIEVNDDSNINLNKEIEALGISISNHPINLYKDIIEKHHLFRIKDAIKQFKEGNTDEVNIVGVIAQKRTFQAEDDGLIAYLKLVDDESDLEVKIYPKIYQNVYKKVLVNSIVVINGHFKPKDEEVSFIAEDVKLLEDMKDV